MGARLRWTEDGAPRGARRGCWGDRNAPKGGGSREGTIQETREWRLSPSFLNLPANSLGPGPPLSTLLLWGRRVKRSLCRGHIALALFKGRSGALEEGNRDVRRGGRGCGLRDPPRARPSRTAAPTVLPARDPGSRPSFAAHSPLRQRIVAPTQQVELTEVQVSAASLTELATADPSCGSGHYGPGDPGPAASLQHHEVVGPGRLQHLAELRLGECDLVEQRVQGQATPVGAQDFGDEAAHLRVRHGAALAWPRLGTLLRGESKLTIAPGASAGGALVGRAPGPRARALRRRPRSPAVSVSHSALSPWGRCHRPNDSCQILKSTATATK